MTSGRSSKIWSIPHFNPSDVMQRILPEDLFFGLLCLDRKRAERSGKKLALLLLDAEDAEKTGRRVEILGRNDQGRQRCPSGRQTRPAGTSRTPFWGLFSQNWSPVEASTAINKLPDNVREALALNLSAEDLKYVYLIIHVFADDSDEHGPSDSANPAFYPDLLHQHKSKKLSLVVKRMMDIFGSLAILILTLPSVSDDCCWLSN